MKEDGVVGQDIVDAVVKNSSTFAVKTEYAQEKYVRKKQKK
jgi:tRNA (adenine-N(1)-)-methyltransferase non-catalytic subunit